MKKYFSTTDFFLIRLIKILTNYNLCLSAFVAKLFFSPIDLFLLRQNKSWTNIKLCLCASVAILFFSLPTFLHSQTISQNLNSNWLFSESGKNKWLAAKVPGTVHTDLWANGEITDPYIDDNASKLEWIETKTWEYQCVFDADKNLWKQKHKDLIFEGLDTYASIYLNDSLLLTTENMFRTYRIDVRKFLKKSQNKLKIVFHPAGDLIALNKSKADINKLPGGDRVFIRKAQYQFGWDFGPRLVTCGIWRPVHLEGWNDFLMSDVKIETAKIENDTAFMFVTIPVEGVGTNKNIKVTVSDGNNIVLNWELAKCPSCANTNSYGSDYFRIPFTIANPRLWWCNGSGKPELYHFKVDFQYGKLKQDTTITTGIRTVKLITVDDALDSTFYFELNGKAIFIKGANWVPCDNFLPRVQHEKYRAFIQSAQQSNMNMLRVWGGGVYEDDQFYNLCDSMGIMVWQDFMFACGMYPGDNHFVTEVYHEASDNIIRLQNHPCISLWCGNNENMEGWQNWDWQKNFKYTDVDKRTLMNNYNLIFDVDAFRKDPNNRLGALGQALWENNLNVSFNYISTSPATGWGHPEAYKKGDVHYWGVWWGEEPFSAYDNHVGRFVTEYGFQGMPALSSFRLFDSDGKFMLNSPNVMAHQKNEKGFATINTYMQRDYPVPTDFSDYVYVSQVMQREGISKAIEAHRRAKSYCMGTLLWQFDDCWPGITWSANDYYGQPKLLNYALKDLYAPLLVSVTERNDSIFIYVVNDDAQSHHGVLGFQWMTFDGANVRTSIAPTVVNGESSNMVLAFDKKVLLDTLSPKRGVMHVVFSYEGDKFVTTQHYFTNTKSLQLAKDPGLSVDVPSVKNADGSYTITLRTMSLVKNVYLSIDDATATFSDNGFDMMPNETREIILKTKLSGEEIKKQLHAQMMNAL